jgi:hypothetical protein
VISATVRNERLLVSLACAVRRNAIQEAKIATAIERGYQPRVVASRREQAGIARREKQSV